jgi:DNA-binding transcriptional LysR family regulator
VALRMLNSNGELLPWQLARGEERWQGLPDGPLAANSVGLQRTLASHGMGIAGLAERFADGLVAQGLLVRVLPDWHLPTVTAWCVTPGRRLLPARTRAFIDMIRAALA